MVSGFMRLSCLAVLIILGMGSVSCTRDRGTGRRDEPAAREAGREAYHASQEVKKGAKEAARELRKAGKEFREGWSEAKHQEPPKQDKH